MRAWSFSSGAVSGGAWLTNDLGDSEKQILKTGQQRHDDYPNAPVAAMRMVVHVERSGSVTPPQWPPECNRDAIAGFTASGLLAPVYVISLI